jgi:hypothetical protein
MKIKSLKFVKIKLKLRIAKKCKASIENNSIWDTFLVARF